MSCWGSYGWGRWRVLLRDELEDLRMVAQKSLASTGAAISVRPGVILDLLLAYERLLVAEEDFESRERGARGQ